MRWVNRWLGAEIIFVHVGHGLLGALGVGIVAAYAPWWFLALLLPIIAFSLAYWLMEARFVMPVARRLLTGDQPPTRDNYNDLGDRCEEKDD